MNRPLIDKSSLMEDCKIYDVNNIFEIYIVPENLGHIISSYSVHHIYAYIYEHILHVMCIYVQICVHVHV